jgi:hypothetical protein
MSRSFRGTFIASAGPERTILNIGHGNALDALKKKETIFNIKFAENDGGGHSNGQKILAIDGVSGRDEPETGAVQRQ